jgi:hypothetical protein
MAEPHQFVEHRSRVRVVRNLVARRFEAAPRADARQRAACRLWRDSGGQSAIV